MSIHLEKRSPGGLEILRAAAPVCKPGRAVSRCPGAILPAHGIERFEEDPEGPAPPAPGQGGHAGGEHPHDARGRARRRRRTSACRARAGCFWGAVAVLVLIVVVSLLSWIFWF